MLDKTIDSALQNLRRDLIRNGGDGLAHVEALMRLRGVPMRRVMPARKPDCAGQGLMRRIVMDALRDGPKTCWEITLVVAERRPEISLKDANRRTRQALAKMKKRELVGRDGNIWFMCDQLPQV